MNELQERLQRARALIADPKTWTQGEAKRRDARVPGGYRYCAVGALAECGGPLRYKDGMYLAGSKLLTDCAKEATGLGIIGVNDGRDRKECHRRVLEAYDCAIEKAGSDAES